MKDREILLEALEYCISSDALMDTDSYGDDESSKSRPIFEESPDIELAGACGVTSLLYPLTIGVTGEWAEAVRKSARVSANRFYRMLYVARYLIDGLNEQGIGCVLIKGPDTASNYQVPEYRSFGDIDILLSDGRDLNRADAVIQTLNCKKRDSQDSGHHIEYTYDGRINIELHSRAIRAIGDKTIDDRIDEIFLLNDEKVCDKSIIGASVRCLRPAYSGVFMLLHMLQHMLAAGFGIKQLCDFTVFWNNDDNTKDVGKYLELVDRLGIRHFSDTVVRACELYMGFKSATAAALIAEETKRDYASLDALAAELLDELFEAEQFGAGDGSRIVSSSSSRKRDLLRIFHAQMKENFPKMCRVWILWPVLWIVTLIIFLRNNRRIRGISAGEVIRNARKRGHLVEKMKLFEV